MEDQEREEIVLCIEGLEKMLKKIDLKGQKYFDHLCDEHGEVKDYESFRKFFDSFLTKFPKKELTCKYNTEEEARHVWNTIDINQNQKLDSDESMNLVKAMLKYVIGILRKHYKII